MLSLYSLSIVSLRSCVPLVADVMSLSRIGGSHGLVDKVMDSKLEGCSSSHTLDMFFSVLSHFACIFLMRHCKQLAPSIGCLCQGKYNFSHRE